MTLLLSIAEALALFVSAALIVISLIVIVNLAAFPRLKPSARAVEQSISVLIPARNEAAVIAETVRSLLAQTADRLEVILLDDGSTDGTGDLALDAAAGDPRLRVIRGQPLPEGWLGKNWACHQLAEQAAGDFLIFTDADVRWGAGALSAVAALADQKHADLLTVWSTQETVTWGERLIIPLMALVILGYLPAPLVHHTRLSAFAAANGQCLAFRRAAYRQVGGHAAVRRSIIEDISMARRIKRAGLRLWMADGNELIRCRMYRSWREVRDGYAKNILAGYGGRVSLLLLASVFHWLIFIAPLIWLIFGGIDRGWALALLGIGIGVRALTAAFTHQRVIDALLMPLSCLLMTVIAARAIEWQWRYGGPRWKDRAIQMGNGAPQPPSDAA
jgi:chlorobactene glucosyltransferase